MCKDKCKIIKKHTSTIKNVWFYYYKGGRMLGRTTSLIY